MTLSSVLDAPASCIKARKCFKSSAGVVKQVGKLIAEVAKEKELKVVFDRGVPRYHGRVKD